MFLDQLPVRGAGLLAPLFPLPHHQEAKTPETCSQATHQDEAVLQSERRNHRSNGVGEGETCREDMSVVFAKRFPESGTSRRERRWGRG